MPLVYLGLGSNTRPKENLQLGTRELADRFTLRAASSVYRNKAIGFEGDDFLNAVVLVETTKRPREVCRELEEIHNVAGRQRDGDPFVSRTLDIDLLLYDHLIIDSPPVRVPRSDVLDYAFVLGPLVDIAPNYVHPESGKTLRWHWVNFDRDSHPLVREDVIL
jgi:2-amino-4-hydroxy-6-hydroxymethyldihydropteridine diphosphokinase